MISKSSTPDSYQSVSGMLTGNTSAQRWEAYSRYRLKSRRRSCLRVDERIGNKALASIGDKI